jgi:hypothetical protein
MRSGPPLVLCALLLFSAVPAALAQKRFCPKPPPSPFKHSGEIVTRFDGSVRRMRTTLEHPRALNGAGAAFYFGATFLHTDPRQGATPNVELVFYGTSAVTRLGAGGKLSLVADGQALVTAQKASFRSQPAGGIVNESAKVSLSLAEVTRLTGARRVSVRMGELELELTHNHLEALRELVNQMAPPPTRWSDATANALSAR